MPDMKQGAKRVVPVQGSDGQMSAASQGHQSGMASDSRLFKEYEYLFDAATAIGTVLVAVLALFGERIRNWLGRPVIKITLENKSPYLSAAESIAATNASDSASISQRLVRIRLVNHGRQIARALSLQVDCVYRQRESTDDFYKEELLPRPIPLKEVPLEDAKNRLDLLPGYPLFIEIAEIRPAVVLGQNSQANSPPPAIPEIFIRIPHGTRGEFYPAGRRKIIFPIIVYSESLRKAERYYVELFWCGADVADLSDINFSVCLLSEAEVKARVGRL